MSIDNYTKFMTGYLSNLILENHCLEVTDQSKVESVEDKYKKTRKIESFPTESWNERQMNRTLYQFKVGQRN